MTNVLDILFGGLEREARRIAVQVGFIFFLFMFLAMFLALSLHSKLK